ncbi:MAG TPA: dihydrofolate reductase family protein [Chloroflexia bacterium]|nr:dihydrofolate reductase family protein [Chloroflexia bacterium]
MVAIVVTATTTTNTPAPQDRLSPFETLYDTGEGRRVSLPAELEGIYGPLRFPAPRGRPYVIGNLVTSLDGVVSLSIPSKAGGKEISGSNTHDQALMGLLRAVADAVIVGAGTLREGNGHPLNAANVYPPLAGAYTALRAGLGKVGEPLSVIVTASGHLDPSMQIFKDGQALVVTTHEGAVCLREQGLPAEVEVVEAESENGRSIPAGAVLYAVAQIRACEITLVEGGPHLLGDFFAESVIDEQFLTLSPQVVGRDSSGTRLGLVEGRTFAPDSPRWGRLSVVKKGGSHLFLRYIFDDTTASAAA